MSTRDPAHKLLEAMAFDAFLRAFPAFEADIATWTQPEDDFPDVRVTSKAGTEIDYELGEWLTTCRWRRRCAGSEPMTR